VREVIRLVDKRNSKEKEKREGEEIIKGRQQLKKEKRNFTLSSVLIALRSDLLVIIIIRQPINFFLSLS
jgi:hypothetical protein